MALNIKSEETDRLARDLAALTGESITTAVTVALSERLARVKAAPGRDVHEKLLAIRERARKIPSRDDRPTDEILGYNQEGTFD